MVKRPPQLAPRAALPKNQTESARYVGSQQHKIVRWWEGLPEAYLDDDGVARRPGKQLTTICPLVSLAERDKATGWVQVALREGQTRFSSGSRHSNQNDGNPEAGSGVKHVFGPRSVASDSPSIYSYERWPQSKVLHAAADLYRAWSSRFS